MDEFKPDSGCSGCGHPHSNHPDNDRVSNLMAFLSEHWADERVAFIWENPVGGIGVLALCDGDPDAVDLMVRGITKVYSESSDKDQMPISLIPITNPNNN